MKNFAISFEINKNILNKNYISLNLEWLEFLNSLQINPVYVFQYKSKQNLKKIFKNIDGVIIVGGGDIYKISKKKSDFYRDRSEMALINFAIKEKLPIIGICRGFQLFASFLGCKIKKVSNHYNTNHDILIFENKKINVNSFHFNKIVDKNKLFKVLGHKDSILEIGYIKKYNFLGLMFHPERKNKSQSVINKIIKNFLSNRL